MTGITSRRKLTGAGCSIASTLTVVLASRLPLRATIVAVPLPLGMTRPLGVTEATDGFELTHSTERVWSCTEPSAPRSVATSWAVARRPVSVELAGKIESTPFPPPVRRSPPACATSDVIDGHARRIAASTVVAADRV